NIFDFSPLYVIDRPEPSGATQEPVIAGRLQLIRAATSELTRAATPTPTEAATPEPTGTAMILLKTANITSIALPSTSMDSRASISEFCLEIVRPLQSNR
ncbi:hypothetical protein HHI36_017331, partial [Cryptolaemus montrouzieri]